MLFNASQNNPFLRCHLTGASDIFLVNVPDISNRGLKISPSTFNPKIEISLKNYNYKRLLQYIGMLLNVPDSVDFQFTLKISSRYSNEYNIYFSTAFNKIRILKSNAWIPLATLKTSRWVDLKIDVHSFTNELGVPIKMSKLETITIYSSCCLSRVYICSAQVPLQLTIKSLDSSTGDLDVEKTMAPITQILDMTTVRLSEWKLLGTAWKPVHASKVPTVNSRSSKVGHTNKIMQPSATMNTKQSVSVPNLDIKQLQVSPRAVEPTRSPKLTSGGLDRSKSANQTPCSATSIAGICPNHCLAPSDTRSAVHTSLRCQSAGPLSHRSCSAPHDGLDRSDLPAKKGSNKSGNRVCFVEPDKAIRLGNMYLFNSLPQPTPIGLPCTHHTTGSSSVPESDWHSPRLNRALDFDQILLFAGDRTHPVRVSVDPQSLQPVSQAELKVKAIFSTRRIPPTREVKDLNIHLVESTGLDGCRKSIPRANPSPRLEHFETSTAAPLDLGHYEHTEDLSASFEASLLASLKEAAMAGSGMRQSELELCMQHPGRVSPFTEHGPSGDAGANHLALHGGLSQRPPLPKRTEAPPMRSRHAVHRAFDAEVDRSNLRPVDQGPLQPDLRAAASFSDDEETSFATAGLGSLIDFPYARKRPPMKQLIDRNENPDSLLHACRAHVRVVPSSPEPSSQSPKASIAETGTQFSRMNSVDDTSLLLTTTECSNCSEVVDPAIPAEWNLVSASSEPNLRSEYDVNAPTDDLASPEAAAALSRDSVDSVDACVQDKLVELFYDPILACYYDPETATYYELK